jgi:hypothetical protein
VWPGLEAWAWVGLTLGSTRLEDQDQGQDYAGEGAHSYKFSATHSYLWRSARMVGNILDLVHLNTFDRPKFQRRISKWRA